MSESSNLQRKKILQLNSEIARIEIERARLEMQSGLGRGAIVRSLTGHARSAIGAATGLPVGNTAGASPGFDLRTLQRLLPYAGSALTFLRRRSMKSNLLLGGAALVLGMLAKKYLGADLPGDDA